MPQCFAKDNSKYPRNFAALPPHPVISTMLEYRLCSIEYRVVRFVSSLCALSIRLAGNTMGNEAFVYFIYHEALTYCQQFFCIK